jgi:hypothetical protein
MNLYPIHCTLSDERDNFSIWEFETRINVTKYSLNNE